MAESLISYTTGDDAQATFEGTAWLAQTFTVGATPITVTSAKVYVNTYNGSGEGYIYIKAVDVNGKPTGSILGTASVTWPTGWGVSSWVEGTFSSSVSLSANTEYALIIRRVPTSDIIYWRYDNSSSSYTDGHRCTSSNSGSTWVVDSNATDFLFDIWGDELSLPSKPINPTPGDEGTGISLSATTVTWEDGGGADTYDIYYGTLSGFLTLVAEGVSDFEIALVAGNFDHYGEIYYWRVDAVNAAGTTQGDEWYFTALIFNPVLPTGITLVDEEPTGDPTGENNMITVRRLVAAANSKIWYEEI